MSKESKQQSGVGLTYNEAATRDGGTKEDDQPPPAPIPPEWEGLDDDVKRQQYLLREHVLRLLPTMK